MFGSEQFASAVGRRAVVAAHHPYRARERPGGGRGRSAQRRSDERLGGATHRRTRGLVRKASRDADGAC